MFEKEKSMIFPFIAAYLESLPQGTEVWSSEFRQDFEKASGKQVRGDVFNSLRKQWEMNNLLYETSHYDPQRGWLSIKICPPGATGRERLHYRWKMGSLFLEHAHEDGIPDYGRLLAE